MLKSCHYCGRIHAANVICSKKPQYHKHGNRVAESIRSSYAWCKKRKEIGERDHYLCRLCLQNGTLTYDGIETHHIIPLEESTEYAFDNDWLINLCVKHHKMAERGEYDRDELHRLAMTPVSPLPIEEKRQA